MEIKLIDNQGNTRSIYMLKSRIQTEIDKGNSVLVNFLQPGVQYLKKRVAEQHAPTGQILGPPVPGHSVSGGAA